jgi:hypothetical protein
MRNCHRAAVSASVLIVTLAIAGSALGADVVKHSGTIVAIAPDATTFVLAEVGRSQGASARPVITRRTIALAPDTKFAIVRRAVTAPDGLPGEFVETPAGPEDVWLNNHVTVECRREGTRLVASKITVPAIPSGD